MSVIVVDSEVGTEARSLQSALGAMAEICDQLSQVLLGVTMPGGGLESSRMRSVLCERVSEIEEMTARMRSAADSVSSETRSFLTEIDEIDSFVY